VIKLTGGAQRARQTKPLSSAPEPAAPSASASKKKELVPWRERALLPLPVAAEVSGLSVGSWYRFGRPSSPYHPIEQGGIDVGLGSVFRRIRFAAGPGARP
jgi:hypothetical protein